MIPPQGDASHWLMLVFGGLLALALLASLVRALKGPTLPDRVVALDLIGFLVIALLALSAIVTQRHELLIVALVAGLILFLGTAALAIYIERRGEDAPPSHNEPAP
jgi:multicomponent Na+:H+ antiporter subunit F